MVICFTGRRPKDLCGYDHERYVKFVQQFTTWLKSLCDANPDDSYTFISGAAQGFDQLAFWAVHKLKDLMPGKIRNEVYVPFPNFEVRWAQQGLFSQQQYKQMLAHADNVLFCSNNDDPETQKSFFRQYMDGRNHKMVKESDVVIALYKEDTWRSGSGGTAECMRWAHKHDKPIIQIKYCFDDYDGDLAIDEVVEIPVFDPTV